MKTSPNGKAQIKIAYIGGGSKGWALVLMKDLAQSEHLSGVLSLYDINHAAAQRNVRRSESIFGHPDAKTRFAVEAPKSLAAALKGADFVVFSIEPGPMQMRYADLEIPLRYGILQTVGDTVGPGGLCRALRAIPIKQHYAHQIMRYCPNAWVINYTNPMTLCTAALFAAEPRIKALGCCHEVFGTQHHLAELVARQFKVPQPRRDQIVVDAAGVNHFTFITSAEWNGVDLFPLIRKEMDAPGFFADKTRHSRKLAKQGAIFTSARLVCHDLMRRFGSLGAAGDRHLVEFVPWYIPDEAAAHRWGVLVTTFKWRMNYARHEPTLPARDKPLGASGEEGTRLMSALLGQGDLTTNMNVPNRGQMPGLPLGHVVETNALVKHDEVRPIAAKALSPGLTALQQRIAQVQALTLQAAMERDRDLALQALLLDPLVSIPTDRASRMLDEMLEYVRDYVPRM